MVKRLNLSNVLYIYKALILGIALLGKGFRNVMIASPLPAVIKNE